MAYLAPLPSFAATGPAGADPQADPKAYIEAAWDAYLALWPSILNLQHRAAVVAAGAPEGSDRRRVARGVVDALAQLAKIHAATVRQVETYSAYLTLGAAGLPVGVLTAFAALALIIAWSFRQYDAQAQILSMIEAGDLTPAEAEAIAGATGPTPPMDIIGGVGMGLGGVALLALAVFAFLRWRDNPDLVVFHTNPEDYPNGVWSGRVYDLRYRHDEDGDNYIHTFRPGVSMQGLTDGSVRLYRQDGAPLWDDFDD